MRGRLCAQTSKLIMTVATTPFAKSSALARCVVTSTSITSPYFGLLVITR